MLSDSTGMYSKLSIIVVNKRPKPDQFSTLSAINI